eukprot:g21051.t1
MVRDWEVLSFVVNRAQVLYKAVSEPALGLPDVEEATSGTADAIDQVGGCAGEPLLDLERLSGAWDGGEVGGEHPRCPGVERSILGAEAEELGIGDHTLAGGW